jgi:ABC-2 type transport system permease protein
MTERTILVRTLRSRGRGWMGWVIALVAIISLIIGVYPSLRTQPGLNEFLDQLPEFVRQITGLSQGLDFASAAGYVNARVMTTTLPVLFMIFFIGAGAQEIAGEERDGTLDMLLAQPVRRSRVLLEKYGALLVLLAGLLAAGLGATLALVAAVGMEVGAGQIAGTALSVTLMALGYGTLSFAIGAYTGSRNAAVAVGAGVVLASYLLWGLAPMVSWLGWSQRLTLFFWAFAGQPIVNGVQGGNVALLAGIAAGLVGIALLGFRRRDIGI